MAQKVSVPVSMVSDRKLRFSPPALRTKCRHRFSSKHFTDILKFSSLRRIFSNHIVQHITQVLHVSLSPSFPLLMKCINIVFQNISQTLSNKNIKPDWQVNFEYKILSKRLFFAQFPKKPWPPAYSWQIILQIFFRNIKITQKNTPKKKHEIFWRIESEMFQKNITGGIPLFEFMFALFRGKICVGQLWFVGYSLLYFLKLHKSV